MKRIAIIGSGGAGKSTFARQLAALLRLPVYHLDALHWKPGWVETPNKEWNQIMLNLVSQDEWIIDGNYGGTMSIRFERADAVIYLDFPTFLCLFRVIKRRFMYWGKTRPDMGEDCPEKIDFQFLNWIYNYRRLRRPSILKELQKLDKDKVVYIFDSPKQLESFLQTLQQSEDD